MFGELLKAVAPFGLPGIMLIVVGYLFHIKDKLLQEEKDNRIEDAKHFNELAMALQKEVITAVNKLSDLVEIWEKREADRERDERRRP